MGLAVEYAHQWAGPARSVIEGVAITSTVCLVVVAIGRWIEERRDRRVTAPIYVSSHALLSTPTIEIPRQRHRPRPRPAMATASGHRFPAEHSQDYWDGVAAVTETLLEPREDDPDPGLI